MNGNPTTTTTTTTSIILQPCFYKSLSLVTREVLVDESVMSQHSINKNSSISEIGVWITLLSYQVN